MTGGRVVVLGATGRNFAAGMSGGVAYVLDEAGNSRSHINKQMVAITGVDDEEDSAELRELIEQHWQHTRSGRARRLLDAWDLSVTRFLKVMPKDYQRVLACIKKAHDQGLTGDEAIMAAFEENARDLARVGGN
jgi:glutamate synthase (ferredoxin)